MTVVCHEWLAVTGGSDKVAAQLCDIIDTDVLYTFALDNSCVADLGLSCPVVTWRWGNWAGQSRCFSLLLPIMPVVWWALEIPAARVTLTSSHACVNGMRRSSGRRVSYCHTPMRYAWEWRLERHRLPRGLRWAMPAGAALLRRLDHRWSRNVDEYIANSTTVARRIAVAYGRTARVVTPPIDGNIFQLNPKSRTEAAPFITAGRLVPYKRFDLAIRAANAADVRLIVAGDGPEFDRLQQLAGPTVSMIRGPDDDTLVSLLGEARAFLFCGVEDFGMLAVEAQACGTPVIARQAGGALDSVVAGETGTFVPTDDVREWVLALTTFDAAAFDPHRIRRHAERFDTDAFSSAIQKIVMTEPVPL